jgi:hypothetical protein
MKIARILKSNNDPLKFVKLSVKFVVIGRKVFYMRFANYVNKRLEFELAVGKIKKSIFVYLSLLAVLDLLRYLKENGRKGKNLMSIV